MTIEADHIILALQQLARNSISANFKNNNINKISKLPKSLTTKIPHFRREISEFRTVWRSVWNKIENPQPTYREDKINYFHSLMSGDALQTFKNTISPNR